MSEQKLEVFNVLNFLNSGYSIEQILNEGNFGTFQSGEDCVKYLIEEGYLEGEIGEISAESDSEALTAEEKAGGPGPFRSGPQEALAPISPYHRHHHQLCRRGHS